MCDECKKVESEIDDEVARKPHWQCQECGFEDHEKPMPPDRIKFYAVVARKGSPMCPRCKSDSYMPVGF